MQLSICAVHDKKTGLYDNPFTVRHTAEAIREWNIIIKDPATKFGKHPADYDLFHIANYNDQLASIEPLQQHIHLASGV